ncbi:sarcosine oxidase subunit gamma [Parasedimentitalea psychrophila]|uniref:Sarcosine oxidase subunit gamma family protein n=1 Tax=Parasedimentitalea psychrophila TaxID=2997337 RepID=A0A9Y2KXN3_9RHOB|nr:sarcosine oxidase subunit gamma family protein [Parasedimentitalea psychrophila]WIY24369.1 sarcosine oxidase subunit gamma family protein [Parasedimentitalea psychrophila]
MTDLQMMTPMGNTTPTVEHYGSTCIAEHCGIELVSLAARRGQTETLQDYVEKELGVRLPKVGGSVTGTDVSAWWTGPDQWMIEARWDIKLALTGRVAQVIGKLGSVVDQSDGWVRYDISGPDVISMFEKLTAIDVQMMQSGTVVRSAIHHIGCFIRCETAGDDYSVYGPRSSADSLHEALVGTALANFPTE